MQRIGISTVTFQEELRALREVYCRNMVSCGCV
jgi:hypothetical protein